MKFPTYLHALRYGKRFNSINRALYDNHAARVYKIDLRLDFTCPNRKGKVAVGDCIYRNNASHPPVNYQPRASVTQQPEQSAAAMHRRHKADRFIACFQSYRNTDADPLLRQTEYAALVVDFLERLTPDIVMHRLSAAAHRAITVALNWSVDKRGDHNAIPHALIQRFAWQGRLYTKLEFRNSLPNMCSEGAEL